MNIESVQLEKLVCNDGTIINKKGIAIFGWGIFDENNNEYPAGYNNEDTLLANIVDSDNNIYCTDSDNIVPNIKFEGE